MKKTCKLCDKERFANTSWCIKHYKKREKDKAQTKKLKKKIKKENSLSHLIKIADILFSQAIRLRDKKCRRTGSKENLQCSHIFSRSHKIIRWDLDNAFTLSAGQHLYWWHKEPAEAGEWAKQQLGEKKWNKLKCKMYQPFKLTPQFVKEKIEFLKDYIKQYENN